MKQTENEQFDARTKIYIHTHTEHQNTMNSFSLSPYFTPKKAWQKINDLFDKRYNYNVGHCWFRCSCDFFLLLFQYKLITRICYLMPFPNSSLGLTLTNSTAYWIKCLISLIFAQQSHSWIFTALTVVGIQIHTKGIKTKKELLFFPF